MSAPLDDLATFTRLAAVLLALASTTVALEARADDERAPPESARETSPPPAETIEINVPLEVSIATFAVAGWVVAEVGKGYVAPIRCNWCDRDADGRDTLNPFDREVRDALRWSSTDEPNLASHVIGFGVSPTAAIGSLVGAAAFDHRIKNAPADLLMVLEATAIAMDLNQVSKFAAARARPDAHARPLDEPTADDNLSFFSGHSTFSFALAAASGTVASMRHYRLAPLVWASNLTVATVTAYLRVAADRHYATDVLGGALIGSAMGASVPLLMHLTGAGEAPAHLVVSAGASPGAFRAGLSGTF